MRYVSSQEGTYISHKTKPNVGIRYMDVMRYKLLKSSFVFFVFAIIHGMKLINLHEWLIEKRLYVRGKYKVGAYHDKWGYNSYKLRLFHPSYYHLL